MEDKKDKDYFKDPVRTTMSSQPINKPGQRSAAESRAGENETTTGEGSFHHEDHTAPYASSDPAAANAPARAAGSNPTPGSVAGAVPAPGQPSIIEPGVRPGVANESEMGGAEANSISRSVSQDPPHTAASAPVSTDAGFDTETEGPVEGVFLPDTEPAQIPVDVQHFEKPDTSHLRDYIGMTVINKEGEDIGSIEDVHSHGGFDYVVMDASDKLFAVPVNALEYIPEEKIFIIDKKREELDNAPGYDRQKGPNFDDMHWNTSLHEFYAKDQSQNSGL